MKRATYRIEIDGQDITSRLHSYLLRLSVEDKEGSSSDTCSIELDDADGQIALPRDGARVAVSYGWEPGDPPLKFVGTVDDIRSSGSRGGGMTLSIEAKGFDTKGKAKEEQEKHWDDKTLREVFHEAAETAGIKRTKIDKELGEIKRPYWSMNGESFIAWAQGIAEEVGGTFKIQGDCAILLKRNKGESASGKPLPTVRAERGVNLHSWDISPILGRARYKKVKARFYDKKAGKWKEKELELDDDEVEATKTIRSPATDEDEAKQHAEAEKGESERNKGAGSVTIEGDETAAPEGKCLVVGTRPGIDGEYTIVSVRDELSRGSGWTTSLELKKPGGEAGKDKRSKKGASSSSSSSSSSETPSDSRLSPAAPRGDINGRQGFASPSQRA